MSSSDYIRLFQLPHAKSCDHHWTIKTKCQIPMSGIPLIINAYMIGYIISWYCSNNNFCYVSLCTLYASVATAV